MLTVCKGTINLFSVKSSWFPILAIICIVLVVLIFAFGVFLSPPLSLNTDNMEKGEMDHTQSAAKCTEHTKWLQNGIYRGLGKFLLTGKNNHQSEMPFWLDCIL